MDIGAIKNRQITMVCFAEYSCYVHFNGKDHIRIESRATFISDDGEYELFPEVNKQALTYLLGKSFTIIEENIDSIALKTSEGSLRIGLDGGYESIMFVIGGDTSVR